MKTGIGIFIAVCLTMTHLVADDGIVTYKTDTEKLWFDTQGKKEGNFDAIGLSMLKWGAFFVVVMGAVACAVHQSKASPGTTTTNNQ